LPLSKVKTVFASVRVWMCLGLVLLDLRPVQSPPVLLSGRGLSHRWLLRRLLQVVIVWQHLRKEVNLECLWGGSICCLPSVTTTTIDDRVLCQGLLHGQSASRANDTAVRQVGLPSHETLGLQDVAVADLEAVADTPHLEDIVVANNHDRHSALSISPSFRVQSVDDLCLLLDEVSLPDEDGPRLGDNSGLGM